MTRKNGDLPAMPTHQVWQDCGIDGNSGPHYVETISAGLTKREYFAALAMQGLVASGVDWTLYDHRDVSEQAVIIADKMLAELERTK